ncbi:hypothetical protein QR98_0006770 [Sarcoptes scabiei]|uniref:Uncharacterized protein n=1 Tax=Sarcoptes scabiei TaxID=52283 RepID=A0A131ZU23_SARSC|nr:hypothetical protein QR98_0006770 [Sarcoptes scabiei]
MNGTEDDEIVGECNHDDFFIDNRNHVFNKALSLEYSNYLDYNLRESEIIQNGNNQSNNDESTQFEFSLFRAEDYYDRQ